MSPSCESVLNKFINEEFVVINPATVAAVDPATVAAVAVAVAAVVAVV